MGYLNQNGQVTCEFKYAENVVNKSDYTPLNTITDMEGNIIVLSAAVGELPGRYADVKVTDDCPLFVAEDADGNVSVVTMYGEVLLSFEDMHTYNVSVAADGSAVVALVDGVLYLIGELDDSAAQVNASSAEEAQNPETAGSDSWTCSCGQQNTGKFCTECGQGRPEEGLKCKSCGFVPEEGTAPKFCSECGAAF